MELSKRDTQMTKGLAIVFMVLLHLFCRVDDLPYECIKIGGVPLVYYIGLISDCCVAIYCFCSGYALEIINQKITDSKQYYINRIKSLFKLLINYWIILILFSIIGLIIKNDSIPISFTHFVKHFFLLEKSYNGAWWFLLTYVLLILISKPVHLIVEKLNPYILLLISTGIYFIAYIQRFKNVVDFNNELANWIIMQMSLLGTSFLPFVCGMIFYKYELFTKTRNWLNKNFNNLKLAIIGAVIFLVLVIGHGIVPSVIVAPFTGLVIIVIFNVVKKGNLIDKIFEFLGEHSTNIWLIHMFFYSTLFKDFVFIAKYPVLIFAFMMLLTICCSYIINIFYKLIIKLIK